MAKNANKNIGTMKERVDNKREISIMALYNTMVCPLSELAMQLWPPQSQKCYSIKNTDRGDEGGQRCGEMSFRTAMPTGSKLRKHRGFLQCIAQLWKSWC